MARDDRERWKASDDFHRALTEPTRLIYSASQAGVPWPDRERIRLSFWRRNRDYLGKNTKATSNVPMITRLALPSTQSAHIVNNQIKLGGGGWGGTFVGQ